MTNEELILLIEEIESLENDSNEEMRPTSSIINKAKLILQELQKDSDNLPTPTVMPDGSNGLVLEWKSPDKTKTLEIHYVNRNLMPEYLYYRSENYTGVRHNVVPLSVQYYLRWEI